MSLSCLNMLQVEYLLNFHQLSRCNWSECLCWTKGEFLPWMCLMGCICCMPRKSTLHCKVYLSLSELCHVMEIGRNPYSFIMNAVLLLLPPVDLCFSLEPMDPVDCSTAECLSRFPRQVSTLSHLSRFHPVWLRSQSFRSMRVAYYTVQPVLAQWQRFQHGGQPAPAVKALETVPMDQWHCNRHLLPCYSFRHACECLHQDQHHGQLHTPEFWSSVFRNVEPLSERVLPWILGPNESCAWSWLPVYSVTWPLFLPEPGGLFIAPCPPERWWEQDRNILSIGFKSILDVRCI